ncbi:MAG TPA: sigma-70 family RNA polymerase sigma factor [Phycisphaerales bacterium]|nr:sigma-70 family RNA polymerase sigma factor [Phycisphaerales bacterium]
MSGAHDLEPTLEAARAGDRDALIRLLDAVGPMVRRRLAEKLPPAMRSSIDEDDLMQVTYIEAVMRFRGFTTGGVSGFLAWVTRLAENNLIDAVRAMEADKRPDPRRRVQAGPNADSMAQLVELLGMTYTTPSRMAAREEANAALDRALAKLPGVYERVIRLYDLEGRPVEEVAAEVGRSAGAVYMLRARAHERLRELLGSASQYFSAS